jgi:hypothetical protein
MSAVLLDTKIASLLQPGKKHNPFGADSEPFIEAFGDPHTYSVWVRIGLFI